MRRKKDKGCLLLVLLFVLFLFVTAGVILAVKFMPNGKVISPYVYFDEFNADGTYTVLHGERLYGGEQPEIIDGGIYIPVSFVKDYVDEYIFWEEAYGALTVTTADTVKRFTVFEHTYLENGTPAGMTLPVLDRKTGPYMPANLLEDLYKLSITYAPEYKTVVIDKPETGRQTGKIGKETSNMRYEPSIKSPIEEKLEYGADLTVYEEAEDGFVKVRTSGALIGYVPSEDIVLTDLIEARTAEYEQPAPKFTGGVNLAWDSMYSYNSNFTDDKKVVPEGVNVLSPTWFKLDGEALDGSVLSIAERSYADFAHENGVQVWALFADGSSAAAQAALFAPDSRDYVIRQLLEFTKTYGLDGINIDFEEITPGTARYYLQFLRELAPYLHKIGVILSVDLYVPKYTLYYNRTEIAKTADYICVMTYDEHYGPASGSGPVASLPFVEEGIIRTLEEVPKEKLIMGLPLYTRVWKETEAPGGTDVSVHRNLAMGYAERIFEENGAEPVWIPDIGSYYGEYQDDAATYKTWFEDGRSVKEKLELFKKHELAGVCSWSREFESPEIWELIAGYIKK